MKSIIFLNDIFYFNIQTRAQLLCFYLTSFLSRLPCCDCIKCQFSWLCTECKYITYKSKCLIKINSLLQQYCLTSCTGCSHDGDVKSAVLGHTNFRLSFQVKIPKLVFKPFFSSWRSGFLSVLLMKHRPHRCSMTVAGGGLLLFFWLTFWYLKAINIFLTSDT